MTRRTRLPFLSILSSTLTLSIASSSLWGAGPSVPNLPERIPTTKPLSLRTAKTSAAPVLRNASSADPEVRPIEENTAAPGESCQGAPCAPYLRNRPEGCDKERIKLYNRTHEPNWYRYYRCCHYGYHPTQWAAWPEGWLTCRHPQPGPHPYDYHPAKPDKRTIDRERQTLPPNGRTEPDTLDEPLPPPGSEEPKPLPPENTTLPPAPPAAPDALPMPNN